MKFVRQAKLPHDAYRDGKEFEGIAYFMAKDMEQQQATNPNKTFCYCHLGSMYDKTKYKGCFHCHKDNYKCCKSRTA